MRIPIDEVPVEVAIETDAGVKATSGARRMPAAGGMVEFVSTEDGFHIELFDTIEPIRRIVLAWEWVAPRKGRYLGDHWERSYGDLSWDGLRPERIMPWYFFCYDGETPGGCGVRTNSASFAFWQVHADGVILNLDLRSGTQGVQLAGRPLRVAEVVVLEPPKGSGLFQATKEFCAILSTGARTPSAPVYGANDWYCSYGRSSQESILEQADIVAEATQGIDNRPHMVIDAGWATIGGTKAGPWDRWNSWFPDFDKISASIRERNLHPGVWIRPLTTFERVPASWILRVNREGSPVLDPTIPEVREYVRRDMRRLVEEWGFSLVKHDFTTFDIFDLWGNEMGREVAQGLWSFTDRTRTNAEVVRTLYEDLRAAAGDATIIGCNTVGHLSVGLFELQRIGDDTSGRAWERTRRMGVNTLAFRACQHEHFFQADADCAPITEQIPWDLTEQWLDLLARSGTPLFVSTCPDAVGTEQKRALREAFARASAIRPVIEPLDWMDNATPVRWRTDGSELRYQWNRGATDPFLLRPKE